MTNEILAYVTRPEFLALHSIVRTENPNATEEELLVKTFEAEANSLKKVYDFVSSGSVESVNFLRATAEQTYKTLRSANGLTTEHKSEYRENAILEFFN